MSRKPFRPGRPAAKRRSLAQRRSMRTFHPGYVELERRILLTIFANSGREDIPVGLDPQGVAVADFNGDHKPDIVVTQFGDSSDPGTTVSVLLGNGNGTFQGGAELYRSGESGCCTSAGDFNGDGKIDLVVMSQLEVFANLHHCSVRERQWNIHSWFQFRIRYWGGHGHCHVRS